MKKEVKTIFDAAKIDYGISSRIASTLEGNNTNEDSNVPEDENNKKKDTFALFDK